MALSNAERQRKHRERVKQKLAGADGQDQPLRNDDDARAEGIQHLEDLLLEEYRGTAEEWLEFMGVSIDAPSKRQFAEVNAANRFVAEKIFYSDLVQIIKMAAFKRLNDFYDEEVPGGGSAGEPEWRKHAKEVAKRVT